jgi:hypothetical protein
MIATFVLDGLQAVEMQSWPPFAGEAVSLKIA